MDPRATPPGRLRRPETGLPPLAEANREPGERALFRLVWLLNRFVEPLTKRDWAGTEHLPPPGVGFVLAANHISNFDPIVIGQYLAFSGRWPHFLGKASLFSVPVMGRIITACGQIPVVRESRQAADALAAAVQAVRDGRCVIIYPEGTITKDPQLWPMTGKTGAARIALATGCPVIPLGQWGAQEVMPGSSVGLPRVLPRKTLRVQAGPPVRLDDLTARPVTAAVLSEATDRILDAITALVADLRQEPAPAVRFDPRAASTSRPSSPGPAATNPEPPPPGPL